MRTRAALFLAVTLAALGVPSMVHAQICNGLGNNPIRAYALETLSINGTATPFTASVYAPSGKAPKMAMVTQVTADIRYEISGSAPTASVGHLSSLNGATAVSFLVCGQDNIQHFQAIAVSSTATITVTYLQ